MIPLIVDETSIYDSKYDVIGHMNGCIKCNIIEERNGMYEAELKISSNAKCFDLLKLDGILAIQTEKNGENQLFRIYKITKPKNQIVTINACHISYDLSGIVVKSFGKVQGAIGAVNAIKKNMVGDHTSKWNFVTKSDNSTSLFQNVEPKSFRNVLGGSQGSFLSMFKGEYTFDNFTVIHELHRGKNRGVSIRYGKNLIDLNQEENIESVYSHVYPFAKYNENDNEIVVEGDLQKVTDGRIKILTVDVSSMFGQEEKVTKQAVNAKAKRYIESNNIGVPNINLRVKFIDLTDTTEYSHLKQIEQVRLCDEVNVVFPMLNVEATAKVVRTNYNALKERYDEIELGNSRNTLSSTIAEIKQSTDDKLNETNDKLNETKTFLEKAIDKATDLIKGGGDSYVVFGTDSKGNKQEIFVMDKPTKEESKNVLRINKNGIGFSKTGINGNYESAWTLDGTFNANFINAGILKGILIEAVRVVGSQLEFGTGDKTITLRDNDSKTGCLFDGKGEVEIKSLGKQAFRNKVNEAEKGNEIIQFINDDIKAISLLNYGEDSQRRNFIQSNVMRKTGNANVHIENSAKSSAKNLFTLSSQDKQAKVLIYNRKPKCGLNRMEFEANESESSIRMRNFDKNDRSANAVSCSSYSSGSLAGINSVGMTNTNKDGKNSNSIGLQTYDNNLDMSQIDLSNSYGGNFRNTITMKGKKDSSEISLRNIRPNNQVANIIDFRCSNDDSNLVLQNLQPYTRDINGKIDISNSITYTCQNWHNFTFIGDDPQFRVGGYKGFTGDVTVKNWDGNNIKLNFRYGIFVGWGYKN